MYMPLRGSYVAWIRASPPENLPKRGAKQEGIEPSSEDINLLWS